MARRLLGKTRLFWIQQVTVNRATDSGELTFNGLRVVDHQNLLLVSSGAEIIVLPISPQQRRQLAPIARGTPLTIGSELLIQTPVQGLEL